MLLEAQSFQFREHRVQKRLLMVDGARFDLLEALRSVLCPCFGSQVLGYRVSQAIRDGVEPSHSIG